MGQTFGPSAPCLCEDWFIWERLVVFLLLSVYKSPPGVFYVRWSEVTHPAPLLISVTSCFSPTQKMLRWCTEEQTATNYKKPNNWDVRKCHLSWYFSFLLFKVKSVNAASAVPKHVISCLTCHGVIQSYNTWPCKINAWSVQTGTVGSVHRMLLG